LIETDREHAASVVISDTKIATADDRGAEALQEQVDDEHDQHDRPNSVWITSSIDSRTKSLVSSETT
jgi:hypothetical protein